jgi:hypothetical protein
MVDAKVGQRAVQKAVQLVGKKVDQLAASKALLTVVQKVVQ